MFNGQMTPKEFNMIKAGDQVRILPEFQDDGDDSFHWVALNTPEKGRLDIMAIDSQMTIKPVHTVRVEWVAKVGV
jgi:hypothetical protein